MSTGARVVGVCGFGASRVAPRSTNRIRPLGKSPAVLDGIGETAPFGKNGNCWDPVGFTSRTSDSLMLWYRAAELKHSRVAMLACTGWIVGSMGITWPGELSMGVKFADLPKNPLEAWAQVPFDGKVQMLIAVGLAEFHSEFGAPYKKHFTNGGPMPGNQIAYGSGDSWTDIWGGKVLQIKKNALDTPEKLRKQQNAELNNGRLAMIGIMGFSAAATVPGSIPLLAAAPGIVAQGVTYASG